MDYLTKPASRRNLRDMSAVIRELFGVSDYEPFPVLDALEKLPDIFEGCDYEVVGDYDLPLQTPACCVQNDHGGYTIKIKESTYTGAYERQVGAHRGHICHEVCHVFLFKVGYTPILERSYKQGEIEAYRSVEWQAKALAGEVMLPYEATKGMSVDELMERYQVSLGFAKKREKLQGR